MSEIDRALCQYAEKITLQLEQVDEADIRTLHALGLTDRAIHDAVQVIGYFNYINRIADALGIENEDFVQHWGELNLR